MDNGQFFHMIYYRRLLDMRSVILLLAAWMVLSVSCQTRKNISDSVPEQLDKSVLWRIDHSSLSSPSYLLGTIHLIPEEYYFWPEEFDHAFQKSEQVAMEIDMASIDPADLMGMMGSLMMSDDQTIEDLVTAEQYEIITQYFNQMGLPFMLLERIKPFFLYMFVSMDIANLDQGSMKSYEMEIMEKAAKENKPTTGLETIETQIALFDSIPYTYQAQMLAEAILEKEGSPQMGGDMDKIFQKYADQDLDGMYQLSKNEEDEIMKEFNLLLIDQRNKNWIPEIEKLIREKSTFIAVGAGHLAGEKGVIPLLRKAGYTLTPVKTKIIHGTD